PLQFRGKASDNAWSSCASCHDDGRTDNVAWSFETGIRKSKDLSGTFNHKIADPESDQGILNWSNVRGSNTDFNPTTSLSRADQIYPRRIAAFRAQATKGS